MLFEIGAVMVKIVGGCQVVLKQVSREYKYQSKTLIRYYMRTTKLVWWFIEVILEFIIRIENCAANVLAQIALGLKILEKIIEKMINMERRISSLILDSWINSHYDINKL